MSSQAIRAQIAAVLRVGDKYLDARISRMKLGPVCSRCSGCGSYSYNQMDGSRCFGCNGLGHMKPKAKDLPAVLEAAKEAAADGRLDAYLDAQRAAEFAKQGDAQLFSAWKASKVARILSGWSSHNYGHEGAGPQWQVPGNFAEVRAANGLMSDAVRAANAAIGAWQYPKRGADVDRGALALAAKQAIENALAVIASADVEPSADLIEFVQYQQGASARRSIERGFQPCEIYKG